MRHVTHYIDLLQFRFLIAKKKVNFTMTMNTVINS